MYLDVVRGLAAQCVLVHHAAVYFLPNSPLPQLGLGAIGVLVFFLLSGFLITGSIAGRVAVGKFSLAEFSISRFSRIFTPYVPAILLVALLDHFTMHAAGYPYAADDAPSTAVANVFMLQDFPVFQILRRLHMPEQPWFFRPFGSGRQFWTVSIEWWIYIAAGLFTLLLLRRRAPAWPMRLLMLFAVIEPAYNLVGGPGNCLTLAWLFGAGANLLYRRWSAGARLLSWAKPAWVAALALAATRLVFTHGEIYDAVFALLLTAVLFLPLLTWEHAVRPLWTRLNLHGVAFHSYSLYLTHLPLLTWFYYMISPRFSTSLALVLVFVGCNAFAVPFARLFEVPHVHVRSFLLRLLGGGQRRAGVVGGRESAAPPAA